MFKKIFELFLYLFNFETFLFIRKNCQFSPKNAKRGNKDFVKNRMNQRKADR